MEQVAQGVYSGAADIGKAASILFAVLGTGVGALLIYAGVSAKLHPPPPVEPGQQPSPSPLVLISIGAMILLFAWVYVWLTFRYKPFAAFEGGSDVLHLI